MALRPLAQRVLISHARPEAFVEKTIAILGRLGYRIRDASEWGEGGSPIGGPELMVVDESRQSELDSDGVLSRFADLPRILLTGRRGAPDGAERIVGAVRRPAGLHDLYRLIQQVFEDVPRTAPRVDTNHAVRCERRGEHFDGALLSLSENGGLLRCEAELPLGACFDMRVELPEVGALTLQAEAAYQLLPNLGVVFSGLAPADRAALQAYVSEALAGGANPT